MSKAKKRHRLFIAGLIVCILLIIVTPWLIRIHFIFHGMLPHAIYTGEMLKKYIKITNGLFPASEDALIQAKLIKKAEGEGCVEYLCKSSNLETDTADFPESWRPLPFFERFELAYGVEFEDIDIVSGKVCEKETSKEVLLIKGPYMRHLTPTYRNITMSLYKCMLQEKDF